MSSNKLTQAFTGSVEVNNRGRLGVTYYDFSSDDPSGGPLDTDYWSTGSGDGGLTFSPRERLTQRSFDMRTAPDARGFFVGDYEGLTSAARRFLPLFATANSGNLANSTDLFSTWFRPDFAAASTSTNDASASTRAQGLASIVARADQLRGPVRIR